MGFEVNKAAENKIAEIEKRMEENRKQASVIAKIIHKKADKINELLCTYSEEILRIGEVNIMAESIEYVSIFAQSDGLYAKICVKSGNVHYERLRGLENPIPAIVSSKKM